MKKTTLYLALSFALATSAFAQDGVLDTGFGNNGITLSTFETEEAHIISMGFQTDGKIVALSQQVSPPYSAFIARYSTTGILDQSFGENGFVAVHFENAMATAYFSQILILSNDKFIISGHKSNATYLKKFNSDGSPDTLFGLNGVGDSITGEMGPIAIQTDEKIIGAGIRLMDLNAQTPNSVQLYRYYANGVLDNNFGNAGVSTNLSEPGIWSIASVHFDSNGKIIIVATIDPDNSFNTPDKDVLLIRCNSDGTLDTTFGTNGKVVTTLNNTSIEIIRSSIILPDNKILCTGSVNNNMAVFKYNADGTLDSTFGNQGLSIIEFGNSDSPGHDLTLQEDGKIIIAGSSVNDNDPLPLIYVATLVRLNSDGSLDSSFGTDGKVTTQFPSGIYNRFYTVLYQNNTILAGGNVANHLLLTKYLVSLNVGTIDFSTSNNTTFVYPNPLDETSVLEYTLTNDEQISIELIDMQGKVIKTYSSNTMQAAGNYKLPLSIPSDLASGTYMLTLSSAKGKAAVKVIK